MFMIRDAIWLMLLMLLASFWYADRTTLANDTRNLRLGIWQLQLDRAHNNGPSVALAGP